MEPIHRLQNSALVRIDAMLSTAANAAARSDCSGIELHVQRLFVQLPREEHAGLGRVDVFVEVQNQVVRHDRVAGGEERDDAIHQVALGGQQPVVQVGKVVGEVDLLDGPGVADGVAVHLVELGIAHGPQGEVETGIQDVGGTTFGERRCGFGLGGETELREFFECVVGEGHDDSRGKEVWNDVLTNGANGANGLGRLLAGLAGLGVLEAAGEGFFVGEALHRGLAATVGRGRRGRRSGRGVGRRRLLDPRRRT